jgi:hypothetical protein
MYIILAGDDQHWPNLGHEIFLTRYIALGLLTNNMIDRNDIIVTKNKERFFLYENTFKKILTYDDFILEKQPRHNCLYLLPYLNPGCKLSYLDKNSINNFFKKYNVIEDNIGENTLFKNIDIIKFNSLNCDLNLNISIPTDIQQILNKKYFIVHIRPTCDHLQHLVDIINSINLPCIIFTTGNKMSCDYKIAGKTGGEKGDDIIHIIKNKFEFKNNIYIVEDLQLYCKLLSIDNCKFLISEISGGGQISHFCFKNTVYYYSSYYCDNAYIKSMNERDKAATNGLRNFSLDHGWDSFNPINSTIKIIQRCIFFDITKKNEWLVE